MVKLEELINSIPREQIITYGKGEPQPSGFALRWSNHRQKWLCGYTGGSIKFKVNNLNKTYVEADDAVEAVAFFVELVSKGK